MNLLPDTVCTARRAITASRHPSGAPKGFPLSLGTPSEAALIHLERTPAAPLNAFVRALTSPSELDDKETRSTYIIVPDADAVYARAKAAGGKIVRDIQKTDYGSREFSVKDPEGHSWSVGTYNPWQVQGS